MFKNETPTRQLRSFGLIVGVGFAVIALWPVVFRAENARTWALILALLLSAAAMMCPSALRWPYRAWMAAGEKLGWINTRVILGVVYYLLIVPIGLILRVLGSDPMRREIDREAESYRIPSLRRSASHMRKQY